MDHPVSSSAIDVCDKAYMYAYILRLHVNGFITLALVFKYFRGPFWNLSLKTTRKDVKYLTEFKSKLVRNITINKTICVVAQ